VLEVVNILHGPRPRGGSAGSWQENRIAPIAAHRERAV